MNKTAIITGAGRGIGRETAILFAQNHYRLFLTAGHNQSELNETADICSQFGPKPDCYIGDIKNENFIQNMFSDILNKENKIDILINNAGIAHIGLFQDMSFSEWHNIIGTNLDSVFLCCRAIIPSMLSQKSGRIINISSVWGEVGASCEAAYSASKGGVNAFTKALAKELAPSGISVNAISFGSIDTSMNHQLSSEEKSALEEEIPYGRFGTPTEAAAFILSVAQSPSYLTGQILRFDGGWQ